MTHALKATSARLVHNFNEAGFPISRQQWLILAKTYHFPNECLLQSTLVDMMMGDKTGVTRAVDDLVKSGWLSRDIDENDRRNRVLRLTTFAENAMPQLMQCVQKSIAEITQGIAPAELETAKKVLEKIIENGNQLNL